MVIDQEFILKTTMFVCSLDKYDLLNRSNCRRITLRLEALAGFLSWQQYCAWPVDLLFREVFEMLAALASLVLCKSTTQYNACLIVWRGHNSNPQQSTNISQRAYNQGRSCSVKPRSSILQRNDLLKKVLYNFIIFPLFLLSIFAKQGQTSSYTFCIWSFDSSCNDL